MATTLERVADFWRARDWDVTVEATQYAGHAVVLARDAAAAGKRLVLAAGGDGTLGEVTNGLAGSETVMGPLPIGTGNSFGKELRMPRPNLIDHRALVEAAASLASGRVYRMDLGRVEGGRYWLLWMGAGIDSHIVRRMEPRSKLIKRLGRVGYVAHGLALAYGFPPMEASVEVDGVVFSGTFLLILITNCRRFGGGEFLLNPGGALDDGHFEVFLFRGQGFARALRYVYQIVREQHLRNPDVVVVRGEKVVVRTVPEIPVQCDGDPAGTTPFTCQIEPGALRLLVPRTAPPGLFRGPGLPLVSH